MASNRVAILCEPIRKPTELKFKNYINLTIKFNIRNKVLKIPN